jgi:hypothetical protein
VQASKPSAVAFGAEGVPITAASEEMSWISSEALSPAGRPFTVAAVKDGDVRFGSAANPAFVPIRSGVSSIHSAVRCVDEYGTVCVNV